MSWLADTIWGNTKKDEPKVYFLDATVTDFYLALDCLGLHATW